jgi:hypothetical protein
MGINITAGGVSLPKHIDRIDPLPDSLGNCGLGIEIPLFSGRPTKTCDSVEEIIVNQLARFGFGGLREDDDSRLDKLLDKFAERDDITRIVLNCRDALSADLLAMAIGTCLHETDDVWVISETPEILLDLREAFGDRVRIVLKCYMMRENSISRASMIENFSSEIFHHELDEIATYLPEEANLRPCVRSLAGQRRFLYPLALRDFDDLMLMRRIGYCEGSTNGGLAGGIFDRSLLRKRNYDSIWADREGASGEFDPNEDG